MDEVEVTGHYPKNNEINVELVDATKEMLTYTVSCDCGSKLIGAIKIKGDGRDESLFTTVTRNH